MKVFVVIPHYREPDDYVRQCLASVVAQTVPCEIVVVSDGPNPSPALGEFPATVLKLPESSRDYGDTPRSIGSVYAVSRGADAIAWLDADNWFQPDHIQTLLTLHQKTKAGVCTAGRTLHHPDGRLLGPCYEVDGEKFVDANCFLIFRPAYSLISAWYLMEPKYHCVDDRIVWAQVRRPPYTHAHSRRPTVCYRTLFKVHYEHFGAAPPPDAKDVIPWPQ